MGRRRGKLIHHQAQGGPVRAVLEANASWSALMNASERNALFRSAYYQSLWGWRNKFLKRRVQKKDVLRPPFNYKDDRVTPMIHRGILIKTIWHGVIKTRAKKSKQGAQELSGSVLIDRGHAVSTEIARVFKIIPPDEMQWIASDFAFRVKEEMEGLERPKRRKGAKPRLRLSTEQRKRLKLKPRKKRVSRSG